MTRIENADTHGSNRRTIESSMGTALSATPDRENPSRRCPPGLGAPGFSPGGGRRPRVPRRSAPPPNAPPVATSGRPSGACCPCFQPRRGPASTGGAQSADRRTERNPWDAERHRIPSASTWWTYPPMSRPRSFFISDNNRRAWSELLDKPERDRSVRGVDWEAWTSRRDARQPLLENSEARRQ